MDSLPLELEKSLVVCPAGLFFEHPERGPVKLYGVTAINPEDDGPTFVWIDRQPNLFEQNSIRNYE